MKRNIYIDIAKCIAIYLVVIGHILSQVANKDVTLITFCHIPCFFLISGFLLRHTIVHYKNKYIFQKKISTLLIPYLFWSAISCFVNVVLLKFQGGATTASVLNEIKNIFIFSRSVWFLIELFISAIIFVFIVRFSEKFRINILLIAIPIWIVLSVLMPSEFLSFYKFKWLFPFMIIGYYIACQNEVRNMMIDFESKGSRILFAGLSIAFPLLVLLTYNSGEFSKYISFSYDSGLSILYGLLYYVISFTGIISIYYLAWLASLTKIANIMADIGKYSVDIYVIHMFSIKILMFIPALLNKQSFAFNYLILPVYAVLITLLIWQLSKNVLHKTKTYQIIMGI